MPRARGFASCASLALFACLLGSLPGCAGVAPAGAAAFDPGRDGFAPLVARVQPSVVSVVVEDGALPEGPGGGPVPDDGLTVPRFGATTLGSGFVVDAKGFIVTNAHVIAHAKSVAVLLDDGTRLPAKIVGHDDRIDLAVLKVEAGHPLPALSWSGKSPRVGDWVLAIGDPYGLGGTVTSGIISARHRDLSEGAYDDFLQTDASINRGSSGGPLFDMSGRVLGVNTSIFSPDGGSVGIGFAIPAEEAAPVIAQLEAHGVVIRGWLGVVLQPVSPEIAKSLNLPSAAGALVVSLLKDAPGARAGLRPGDVILSFDGTRLRNMPAAGRAIASSAPGAGVDLEVWRRGALVRLHAVMGRMPENLKIPAARASAPSSASSRAVAVDGLVLRGLTAAERAAGVSGVMIAAVADGSPFAAAGFEAGDVIESLDQRPAVSPEGVARALAAHDKTKPVLVLLRRGDGEVFVAVPLAKGGEG